jgi:hypothetical protein
MAITRKAACAEADADSSSGGGSSSKNKLKIEAIEPDHGKKSTKEVAWLGISTEEASEAVAAQLGLKPGDGLVVVYVEADSPAAKAGLQKYDVLVQLGDQLLVTPGQLRKLVRRQKEGDVVNLTFYRAGKKQSVSATLAKTTERMSSWDWMNNGFQYQFNNPKISETIHDQMKDLEESLAHAGLDKKRISMEVQRGIEEARKALHEALGRNGNFAFALGPDGTELEALAKGGVDIGKNTTVTVKKDAKSVRTIVKADDDGTYVIVANPKKRLTVHDNDGKILFDGEIETKEQQGKVPPEIWLKAKPMLEEMSPAAEDQPEPEAQSTDKPKG